MTIHVTIMKFTARSSVEWVSINSRECKDEADALSFVNAEAQLWVNEGRKWAMDNKNYFELCSNNNRFFSYVRGKVSYDNLGNPADMAANGGQFQWMAVLDEDAAKRFHEAHKDEHCNCDGSGATGCPLHDLQVRKLVA